MKYEHMTKDEARDYLNDLEALAEESVSEDWFFEVEEETERYYIAEDEIGQWVWEQCDIDKAKEDLYDLIEEVIDYVEHYDEREKEFEDYKHMVAVESRYW